MLVVENGGNGHQPECSMPCFHDRTR